MTEPKTMRRIAVAAACIAAAGCMMRKDPLVDEAGRPQKSGNPGVLDNVYRELGPLRGEIERLRSDMDDYSRLLTEYRSSADKEGPEAIALCDQASTQKSWILGRSVALSRKASDLVIIVQSVRASIAGNGDGEKTGQADALLAIAMKTSDDLAGLLSRISPIPGCGNGAGKPGASGEAGMQKVPDSGKGIGTTNDFDGDGCKSEDGSVTGCGGSAPRPGDPFGDRL